VITVAVLVAAVVVGVPLLVICWALLLLVFREAAILAVMTVTLVPVFGPWVILFNVLAMVALRAMCRR
jgi:hypothetical protein